MWEWDTRPKCGLLRPCVWSQRRRRASFSTRSTPENQSWEPFGDAVPFTAKQGTLIDGRCTASSPDVAVVSATQPWRAKVPDSSGLHWIEFSFTAHANRLMTFHLHCVKDRVKNTPAYASNDNREGSSGWAQVRIYRLGPVRRLNSNLLDRSRSRPPNESIHHSPIRYS